MDDAADTATGQDRRVAALVIGAGPAGLMAAEALARAGLSVLLAEAKPSPGRKLLMAGKSGLNLTKDEPAETFLAQYEEAAGPLAPMLRAFGPAEVAAWAEGLGQPVFTGSSGRVFPRAMKASPLLRAWLARLDAAGVRLETRWRWAGWRGESAVFQTSSGPVSVLADVTVLALGGASWARLGSDGAWADTLRAEGAAVAPFRPANVGLRVEWSSHMARQFGQPVKGVALCAGGRQVRGEFVVSRRGLEGGAIYALSRPLREGAPLIVDLMPNRTEAEIAERLARPRGKASLTAHLRKTLRLQGPRLALLYECARPLPQGAALAARIKALAVPHGGPRPLDEAISTAGGVDWAGLDAGLMLTARPGVFCAGEMLDWEAPTGGYLLTACLATGRWAGQAAARRQAALAR
ncbi:putative flavoprotein (TIGR03862 family) [Rhodovulum iodosum]|uniref:Flavoprotein (TIGR03862 family) n=1 Tax=Rhodovulum iodosum TaxID=68291 RepID=A0ABV3XUJ6_9RHOB|nr:TIGR03862 family flavoprotein [Rhodovulum robiginosum]RSK30423.1 TIGR03862 family flavoprotein [Rhodovulum robiginosum]